MIEKYEDMEFRLSEAISTKVSYFKYGNRLKWSWTDQRSWAVCSS